LPYQYPSTQQKSKAPFMGYTLKLRPAFCLLPLLCDQSAYFKTPMLWLS